MSPFLRKVTTASGATAVQVVAKQGRRSKVLEHLGSAHSKAELAALMEAGKAKLHAGQGELALDFPAESDPAAVVQSSASRLLIEAITMAWEALGFDDLDDKAFFQLIAARYEQGSLLVTSNMPFGRWGEIFGDDIVAAAMIDRLVHHAEVLTLSGDSYRTRARRELLKTTTNNTK